MFKPKFVIVFLMVFFSVLFFAHSSWAATFFQENWDSGTPDACWPCKTESCGSSFNGWRQSTDALVPLAGLSTAQNHSGTRSFYQYRAPGLPYGCDINHVLSTPYPTTIYLRFYLYMTSNWNTSETNNASWMHWIFTNSARSSTGFRINMVTDHEWGPCPQGAVCILPEGDGGVQWWNTSWPAGINLKSIIGTWTCFEYKMQISGSNVILTEWINGIQTRGPITGPGQNTSSFNNIIFSGWENTGANFTGDHYIDDIVVSDSYIGPIGGGDTQSPTAPMNLSALAVSSSQINLSWTASTDNTGVIGYRIYRCQGVSCTPSTQISTSGTNSYSDIGLTANTAYVYRVAAYDAAGNVSDQSSSASATTQALADTTPPAAPSGVAIY